MTENKPQQNPQKFEIYRRLSCQTYEEAMKARESEHAPKIRIRKRSDRSFDVCFSKEIKKEEACSEGKSKANE